MSVRADVLARGRPGRTRGGGGGGEGGRIGVSAPSKGASASLISTADELP
jgi:hypothetical protein